MRRALASTAAWSLRTRRSQTGRVHRAHAQQRGQHHAQAAQQHHSACSPPRTSANACRFRPHPHDRLHAVLPGPHQETFAIAAHQVEVALGAHRQRFHDAQMPALFALRRLTAGCRPSSPRSPTRQPFAPLPFARSLLPSFVPDAFMSPSCASPCQPNRHPLFHHLKLAPAQLHRADAQWHIVRARPGAGNRLALLQRQQVAHLEPRQRYARRQAHRQARSTAASPRAPSSRPCALPGAGTRSAESHIRPDRARSACRSLLLHKKFREQDVRHLHLGDVLRHRLPQRLLSALPCLPAPADRRSFRGPSPPAPRRARRLRTH